jgi:sugar/nucleoside kinase (ribokinase family)
MDQAIGPVDAVVVFGGATLDRIARSDGRLVMGASNPGTVRRLPGGVGFNVASILARLGLTTRLVTRVGDDPDGQAILTAAKYAGVDVSAVTVSPGLPTASYHATFDESGSLAVGIADMAICKEITPAAIAAIASEDRRRDFWVVDANLPPETLAFLAAEATAVRRPIAALTVSPAKAERWVPLLDQLSYLFANRREAAVLLGHDPDEAGMTASRLASALARPRLTRVVVTNGAEPLAAAAGIDTRSYVVLRTMVKTVNGAGDSLAAGTIAGLAQGRTFGDAVRLGLAAAALTLESGGVTLAPFTPTSLTERIGASGKRTSA